MPVDQPASGPHDLQAALDGSACLGAWTHDVPADRFVLPRALADLLGIDPDEGRAGVALPRVLARVHADDGLRIESVLHAASESGVAFEAEFRTRPAARGARWVRLMGRAERDPASGAARTRGLAFDLTENRCARGTPAEQAQQRVNQLADHVVAMEGLVAALSNPPLAALVRQVAVEVGFELARRLPHPDDARRH